MLKASFLRSSIALLALILCLGFLLGLGIQRQSVLAQSESGIRSEVSSLRTRVDRLETEIRRINQSVSRPHVPSNSSPSPNAPAIVDGVAVGRSDPMFERLATLVIELKERVNALEQRMTQMEAQKPKAKKI